MKSAYKKDSRRMFKNNLGRFISIVLIIMLGVAFFVGMNEVAPVMKQTAEEYMKEYNIYDYNLVSNLGYNDEDIEKIKNIENIEEVKGIFSYDALASYGEKDITVRIFSGENDNKIDINYISEGRNIKNVNECLISSRLKDMYGYEIGKTIKLYRNDNVNIEDSLNYTEFKIVGIAKNPMYISKFYGNTVLLTGDLNSYIIVSEESFKLEEYTTIYCKANIDEKISRFSSDYEEKNKHYIDSIEGINYQITKEKYDKIFSDASEKIRSKEEKIKEVEKYLEEKYKEIRNSQLQINEGIVMLSENVAQYYKTNSIYENAYSRKQKIYELYNTLFELESQNNLLEKEYNELKDEKANLETNLENIENKIERNLYELYSIENEASQFVSLNKENYKMFYEYNSINSEYQKVKNNFDIKKQNLDKIKETINITNKEIKSNQEDLYSSFYGQKDLIEGIGNIELTKSYTQINSSKEKIEESIKTLEGYNIEEKLTEVKDELRKSKDELNKFEMVAETTPLYKNSGFKSLKEDLAKIAIMGRIFPVMFFVIAALVTITTVTRMIEVDRKNIGTLKALGYHNEIITERYIKYALLAGILGTVMGCIIGSLLIVEILFVSYSSLYDLPNLVTRVKFEYIFMAFGVSLISTVFVAWVITKKELKENTANLMRPKTETTGKIIILEKVPFLWNRLDFLYKISFRNIFRYKKRLLMTLIGIAGCTALIYAGLGLRDAINSISDKQFKSIRTLSMEVYLTENLEKKDIKDVVQYLLEQEYIEDVTPVKQQSLTIAAKDNTKDVFYIVAPEDEIDKYIKLKDRKNQEQISLNDEGVVLTEKLATILNISVGEKIDIIDGDAKGTLKVIGITENYLYNLVYFTPAIYERICGTEVKYNELFVNTIEIPDEEQEIKLSDSIKKNDKIAGVVFNKNLEKEFKTSLASLMSIVILFLVCASILSFTVLINLNNINIEERRRELSTIKLLGFYEKELESYVFRENIILTVLGTLLGLIIGMGILGIIIQAAEVETIFLVKDINYINLGISVIITLSFTFITNLAMKKKIKNIDMVESLKSIE